MWCDRDISITTTTINETNHTHVTHHILKKLYTYGHVGIIINVNIICIQKKFNKKKVKVGNAIRVYCKHFYVSKSNFVFIYFY